MTTTTVREFTLALQLVAYGMELRLWKQPGEREWGASLREGNNVVDFHFEEDNLTLAKLHVLGDARNRAVSVWGAAALPGCDTFINAWKLLKMTKS